MGDDNPQAVFASTSCVLSRTVLSKTVLVGFGATCAGHLQQHTEFHDHVRTTALLPSMFLCPSYSRAMVEPCALLVVDRAHCFSLYLARGCLWKALLCSCRVHALFVVERLARSDILTSAPVQEKLAVAIVWRIAYTVARARSIAGVQEYYSVSVSCAAYLRDLRVSG